MTSANEAVGIPVAISIGAVIGALSRYYITLFWLQKKGGQFPYGTLFVNLTGAFIVGLVSFLLQRYEVAIALQKLVIVGFLGSYTTFSSYILDTANLLRNQHYKRAIFYWLGSSMLGLICVEFGSWLAHQLT